MATIRQQILIEAPTRTLWNLLTTAEGIVQWWATTARVEGREGGRVVLGHRLPASEAAEGGGEPTGEDVVVEERGMIHTWRPTATFEVKWDSGGQAPTRGTTVQFQIGRGDGESKLHVIHSGGGVLDDELARAALEDVWKERLTRLRTLVEGG
jgi:uncharacterized protein YndB with AHSA1/START domain